MERLMTMRTLLILALVLANGAVVSAEAQCGYSGYCGGSSTRTVYEMDANGNYTGTKRSESNNDGDDGRYACFPAPAVGPVMCNPCASCHTASEATDKTYRAKFDGPRHMKVHFPPLFIRPAGGVKLAWGKGSHLSMRGGEVVISNVLTGRDQSVFPVGTTILRDLKGVPAFIVLPATGEPKLVSAVK